MLSFQNIALSLYGKSEMNLDEAMRETSMDKLMPPLVSQLRRKVKEWRDSDYVGATDTSKSLLNWWFNTRHLLPHADGTMAEFQYYFAQREALETIIYLYDVVGVEAISQNVVKHPVLPDAASRAKLVERQSAKYTEKYADYLHLGVVEWRKAYAEHEKMGKKAILFVMTDDTRNCDDVAEYLEDCYDVSALRHQPVLYLQFSEEEQREIVFKDITTGEVTHTTILDTAGITELISQRRRKEFSHAQYQP